MCQDAKQEAEANQQGAKHREPPASTRIRAKTALTGPARNSVLSRTTTGRQHHSSGRKSALASRNERGCCGLLAIKKRAQDKGPMRVKRTKCAMKEYEQSANEVSLKLGPVVEENHRVTQAPLAERLHELGAPLANRRPGLRLSVVAAVRVR